VIDMICYRRFGHNEGDEPAFTQPIMYRKIRKHPTTVQLYADRLIEEGVISRGDSTDEGDWPRAWKPSSRPARGYKPNKADWLDGKWSGLKGEGRRGSARGKTGLRSG
jgi:2-oxoglutarate dehydrogenase E1 component